MFNDPDKLELDDELDSVGVGVVPAGDTAAGTTDLEWTLPADEFEDLLDVHSEQIDDVATFSTEAREHRPERFCTQDLFVLFVESVGEFEDEIIPERVPEPEDDTDDTPSPREVILFPLNRLASFWYQTILHLLGVVVMTVTTPFEIAYRIYYVLRGRHTE